MFFNLPVKFELVGFFILSLFVTKLAFLLGMPIQPMNWGDLLVFTGIFFTLLAQILSKKIPTGKALFYCLLYAAVGVSAAYIAVFWQK